VIAEQVTIGGQGANQAVIIVGPREERLALLTTWAEAEGCSVVVGDPLPERVASAAAYYGGRSGTRTGD
jgi:hypothetical protein